MRDVWVKILGNRLANRGFPPRKVTGSCRLTLRTDLVDGTVITNSINCSEDRHRGSTLAYAAF